MLTIYVVTHYSKLSHTMVRRKLFGSVVKVSRRAFQDRGTRCLQYQMGSLTLLVSLNGDMEFRYTKKRCWS